MSVDFPAPFAPTSGLPLDMRELTNGYDIREVCNTGKVEMDWRAWLENSMVERAVAPAGAVGVRAARQDRQLDLLRRIASLPLQEQLDIWERETGRSRATFFRRLSQKSQKSQNGTA